MSDGGEKICPLCAEEMDLTDQQLKPCKCGYEICVWCWHHIIEMAEKDGIEGRCPNCRTAYDKDRIVGADANCRRVVAETNTDKKLKSQKGKSKPSAEARKQLSSVRVIQRNLVYIIGLPLTVGDVNILERREYFGQYGRVLKVSVSRATGANQQPANTLNAYITYAKEDEAVKCIQAVHNFVLDGKPLRACFGTTKYCNTWLRNLTCSNPDCFYLHDIGNQEDSFTKDEIISAYTRTRIPQVATNNLQNRMGSVLPPPVDDFCSTGSVTSAKCASKNSTNNPITSVKGGCRSTALPAAASWGSRTVRHNPTSSSCDKGKQKQDASSLTPVTSSLIETSTWPDDMAKYEENHNDNHSSITNGKSRHSESSQSSSSNDSQVSSAWDDETITLKDPEEHGKEVVNGASGPPATKPFLACEVLGSFSGRPVDTFHEGGVITSAWDDDDEDNVADEENMTHPNDQFVPFQTLKSSGSEKQREFVEAPANDMQDATCTRSEMAKSDGEYQVSAEGLEVTVNHNMGNSNEVMLSNFDNPLHSILMKNSNNVTSNGKMESALSSLDINRHQLGLQENNENWDNDPIILKAVAPRVSGLNQSCHDQFRLFSNHPYGETPALNNDSFLSREPSNLSSMPVKEVVPLIRNEIRNASGLPEIHYQPHSDNKTSYPCIQASDVMENSAYQNNSFGSRHTTDMKKIVNANYLVHATQHDSKLGNIDAGRNCTYGDSTDSIKRVGSLAFSQNGERVNNRDTSESIIISNMLSMDFDPWSQDAAASTIMKQLTESAGLNASFNSHNSLKSPSNSQSRFSFARQDYQTGYFGSGSQDSTVNGFQNGYTTHTMQGSSPGISSIHSDFSSERTSVISRAKVSAPPGFSAPSRPPPPGFSSQDRSNLLFNSGPSGNQNLMNFSPGYQPQHVSTGDVEFHDPAILAVGKGTMPVKYDLGVDSFFPIQRGVSDIDPKYHLSMNFNLPSNQQHRISGHSLDGILHMNDGFAPRFTEQNHANSLPFSQVPLNSFISTRNSGNSNTHWDYWNHLQSGNNLDSAEIMKNDRLGINYSLTGEDYKFYTANSNKLYNQAFGI